VKKKWSFRSISFSRKDKSKPQREDKNVDVTKEEVAEANEEKIEASEAEASPATHEESDSHAANDNEITEKKEEIVAAEVETKSVDPVAVEIPPPEQVKESDNEQQATASSFEPTAQALHING
jgi:hypothetical protein